MRVAEWIIVVYLAYLLGLLPFRRISRSRRLKLLVLASLAMAVVASAPWWPASAAARAVRTWLPMPFVLVCYWLTGVYFVAPQPEFEARFAAFDERARAWLGATNFVQRAPRLLLEFLEVSYFGCYVVVALGMVALYLAGRQQDSDRYWSVVTLAELASYGVLPWIQTRPPWALRPSGFADRRVSMHEFNLRFVRATSTCANTFPSGHAAGALAVALVVAPAWPLAGAGFFFMALSISAGAVFGEYHYAGDAVTGAATALVAWGLIQFWA